MIEHYAVSQQVSDGILKVIWSDGHISEYDAAEIKRQWCCMDDDDFYYLYGFSLSV